MTITTEGIDANLCHYSETETEKGDVIRVTWDHCYCVETCTGNGAPIPNADARVIVGRDVWLQMAAAAYSAHVLHQRENNRDSYEERES